MERWKVSGFSKSRFSSLPTSYSSKGRNWWTTFASKYFCIRRRCLLQRSPYGRKGRVEPSSILAFDNYQKDLWIAQRTAYMSPITSMWGLSEKLAPFSPTRSRAASKEFKTMIGLPSTWRYMTSPSQKTCQLSLFMGKQELTESLFPNTKCFLCIL